MISGREIGLASIAIGILMLFRGMTKIWSSDWHISKRPKRSPYAEVDSEQDDDERLRDNYRKLLSMRIETYALAVLLLAFGCFIVYFLEPHLANLANPSSPSQAQEQLAKQGDSKSLATNDGQRVQLKDQYTPTPTPHATPSVTIPEAKGLQILGVPSFYRWSFIGLVILFLIGLVLVGYGLRSGRAWAKVGGTITMAASLIGGSSSFSLFKIDKIESIFTGHLDKLFELKINKGGFSPGHIIRLEGFCLSNANLKQGTVSEIRESCGRRNLKDSHAFLLVVGATDNLPITRGPFESNFGLARARAEKVRDILLGESCNMPENNVLALVSGPRHTDVQRDNPQSRKGGTAEDRSVDVWAFWDKPTASDSKLGKFELFTSVGMMGSQQGCSLPAPPPIHRKTTTNHLKGHTLLKNPS